MYKARFKHQNPKCLFLSASVVLLIVTKGCQNELPPPQPMLAWYLRNETSGLCCEVVDPDIDIIRMDLSRTNKFAKACSRCKSSQPRDDNRILPALETSKIEIFDRESG